jgi:hypothetical protein
LADRLGRGIGFANAARRDSDHKQPILLRTNDTSRIWKVSETIAMTNSSNAGAKRMTVQIPTASGEMIEAWVYQPEGSGPHPAVVMAHGIGGIKAGGLAPFAERFREEGFAIAFDYRNFGGSGGQPREVLSVPRQRADYSTVIGWASEQPYVDTRQIIAWGTSFDEMMEAAFRPPARTGARPDWMEPFARTIDAAKKYVVSNTLDRVDWNAELVRGDLGTAVQQLKREPGKGLLVGGVKLPLALAELGLIDEYEFVVQPRLVGHGPTLFAGLGLST